MHAACDYPHLRGCESKPTREPAAALQRTLNSEALLPSPIQACRIAFPACSPSASRLFNYLTRFEFLADFSSDQSAELTCVCACCSATAYHNNSAYGFESFKRLPQSTMRCLCYTSGASACTPSSFPAWRPPLLPCLCEQQTAC